MKKLMVWSVVLSLLLPSPSMSLALADEVDITDIDGVEIPEKNPNAGKDMMQPASGVLTHLPIDGDYKYPENKVHIPDDAEWSGKKEGERCNFSAQHEKPCNQGLECVEEFNRVKWPDAPKRCNFYNVICQGNDKPPRERCVADCKATGNSNEFCQTKCFVSGISDKCSYEGDCLYTYMIPLEGQKIPFVTQCTAHSQCSSGYCMKLEGIKPGQKVNGVELPADLKVCMPYSKCTQPCLQDGETITSGRTCCDGLVSIRNKNGVNICSNPVIDVPPVPKDIDFDMTKSCKGRMWEVEEDGSKAKNGAGGVDFERVAKKNWTFSRYMAAVEWVWGESEKSGLGERSSREDFFKLAENARDITKKYRTKRLAIDKDYLKVMIKLEQRKQQLLTETKDNNSGASNSKRIKNEGAGGIAFMNLMAEHLMDLSGIHSKKITLFAEHMGELKGNLEIRAGLPAVLEEKDNPYYKYNKYGKRDWILYCEAWFPHCWFSENSCGTYFQKNKVCVNEVWDTQGSGDITKNEKRYILDPIYPAVLKDGGGGRGKDFLDDAGSRVGGAATGALVGVLVLGPVGLVLGAIFGALFGSWNPKFYDWYNNDMPKLLDAITKHFTTYADKPFPSDGDAELEAYITKNGTHYIPEMMTKDEVELKLKEKDSGLSPEQIKAVLNQMTVPKLRTAALGTVSDFAQLHLLTFSASDRYEYEENDDNPAPNRHLKRTKDLILMTDYLRLYHSKMSAYAAEMSACYTALAAQYLANMGNHASNIQTDTGLNLSSPDLATFKGGEVDLTAPDAPGACAKGECTESELAVGGLGGIDGMSGTASGGKAGLFSSSDLGRKAGQGGDLSGKATDGTLAAARKRRADFLRSRGLTEKDIKGKDREGTDRLFSELSRFESGRRLASRLTGQPVGALLNNTTGADSSAVSGAGLSGSGSGDENAFGANANAGGAGNGNGAGYAFKTGFDYKGNKQGGSDSSSGSSGDNAQLLQDLEREKLNFVTKEGDNLFKKITNAYILYAFPRLLKKKDEEKR
jgi:hypothetical protein